MTGMQIGTADEIEILRSAVTVGVFLGVIYDFFVIIRRQFTARAVEIVCDVFYSLIFGAVFFVFSLVMTDYYRMFILFGMLAGAIMWCVTFGRLMTGIVTAVFTAVSRYIVEPVFVTSHKFLGFIRGVFVRNRINSQK